MTTTDARAFSAYVVNANDGAGSATITNAYGYYVEQLSGTNNYAFYDATNSLSVFGDIQTQAVSITDNLITTNRSNDNLNIEANGTGQIQIRAAGGDFANYSTAGRYESANNLYYENLSTTLNASDRKYQNNIINNIKFTSGQNSSSSNDTFRNTAETRIDLNGSSATATSATYRARGPMGFDARTGINNSSGTASTLGNASGGNYGIVISPSGTGNITITNTTGMGSYLDVAHNANMDITITDHVAYESVGIDHYGSGTGNFNITDFYSFRAGAHSDAATATLGLTNNYGFYFEDDSTATNTYAFYSASDTAKSRVGSLERYREEINTLTSSSTITVDCSLAPVHTVALGTNTGFVITNLGTGQSVTIIIKSSGTYTATFGTDGSTAVKFPGGAPTITDSGTDVVTIFNDGTDYLGNIAQAYA
jgi:hypothetical protein